MFSRNDAEMVKMFYTGYHSGEGLQGFEAPAEWDIKADKILSIVGLDSGDNFDPKTLIPEAEEVTGTIRFVLNIDMAPHIPNVGDELLILWMDASEG